MTIEIETQGHPSDEALAGWIDARIGGESEPVEIDRSVTPHLAGCAECRARVQELERIVALLRSNPASPPAEEIAVRKARVMEAIERGATVQPIRSRSWWWVPAIAAAALAILLVTRPWMDERNPVGIVDRTSSGTVGPTTVDILPEVEASLPVDAAASAAADEAAHVIAATDDAPDDAATLDPREAASSETLGDVTLVDEFASLPSADQQAILDDLEAMEFEL